MKDQLKQHSRGRKHHRGKPVHREVDGQLDHQPVKSHSFQVDSKGATSLGGRQSVPSCWITTPSQSEIKSASNDSYCSSTSRTTTSSHSHSEISGFLPKGLYYQPHEDQETYCINSEGHLQCHQDPQNIISVPTPRSFLSQWSTLSTTNVAQSRSAVLRTFLGFTLTVLTDLANSRESMTLKWTLQCQFNMQGGRCQLKAKQLSKRPLTTW